jgi:hypothetical protein
MLPECELSLHQHARQQGNKFIHNNNKSFSSITWRYFRTHYVRYMRVPTFREGSQDNTSLLVLCSPLNEAFSRLAPVRFAFSRNNGLPEAAVGFAGYALTNGAFVLFKDEYWWFWRQRQLGGTANKRQWPGCHKETGSGFERWISDLCYVAIDYTVRTTAALSLKAC